jgi:hypothetical protein
MITQRERDFAENALASAERMLGMVMLVTTQEGAPTPKAKRMAQALITTGLVTKLGMSRESIDENFSSTFDALSQQLEAQWAALEEGDEIDLGLIDFPDGPDDYINQLDVPAPRGKETVQ